MGDQKTQLGKAPGPDELPTELYKCNDKLVVPMLSHLFNEALETGALPASTKVGIITLPFKKKEIAEQHCFETVCYVTDFQRKGRKVI